MADYTNYEFTKNIKQLQDFLLEKEGWGEGYKSASSQILLEGFVDAVDNLHYMLERRVQEQFYPTARLKSSIFALANGNGYRPRRKVSSKGEVFLVLKDPEFSGIQKEFVKLKYLNIENEEQQFVGSADKAPNVPEYRILSCEAWTEDNVKEAQSRVNIPRYQSWSIQDENFVNTESIVFYPGDFYKTFEVAQGTMKELVADATSPDSTIKNQEYYIINDYKNIDENIFNVYDALQSYRDVRKDQNHLGITYESIGFADKNDRVFDLRITINGLEVLFGNDVYGFKPSTDITFSYLETKGNEFSIESTNLEVNYNDVLTDNNGNSYDYRSFNTTSITNGLKEEDAQNIKQRAPEFIRSGNRAVTEKDYEYWIKQSGIGGILDTKVFTEEEEGLSMLQTNNVYVVYLNKRNRSLRVKEVDDLQQYMQNYKILTTLINPMKASEVPLKLNISAKKREEIDLPRSSIFSEIKEAVENYFEFEEGKIGKSFYISEFLKILEDLTVEQGGQLVPLFRWVDVNFEIVYEFTYNDLDSSKNIQLPLPVMPRTLSNNYENITNNFLPESFTLYKEENGTKKRMFNDSYSKDPLYTKGEFGDSNIIDYYYGEIQFNTLETLGKYYITYRQNEESIVEINKKHVLTFSPFNEFEIDEDEKDPIKSTIRVI